MSKSAEDILKSALLLERRGKAFYSTTARQTESEAVRRIFTLMAEEEEHHIDFLSKQFAEFEKTGRFLRSDEKSPPSETEAAMILSEQVQREISAAGFEAAAISAAIDFEDRAIKLYQERASEAVDPIEKQTYQMLADWERSHFRLLHKLNEDLKERVWYDNSFWPF